MQSYGSKNFSLQNRYSTVFRETISIHHKIWRVHRRYFAYALFLLLAVPLSGGLPGQIAKAAGTLSFSPSSVSFGSVTVGSSKTVSVTIKNTGTSPLTLRSQSVYAPAIFGYFGVTIPKTLAAGASVVVSIRFAPTVTGTFSGYVLYTSDASNSSARFSLSGTGTTGGGTLSATPSSLGFGTVAIGTTNSQTVLLKNTGSGSMTISSATVSGTGFRMSGVTVPLTLAAAQTKSFTVSFAPSASGSVTGSVTLKSTATNPTYTIAVSGSGSATTRTISLSTSSLNFGNETVGQSSTLGVSIKNTGNSSLTISAINVTASGFGVNGGLIGATIAAGQTANLNVVFAPILAGSVTGKVSITSNATNSPNAISVTGNAVSSGAHYVALNWTASASTGVVGYYVYRSSVSGSSYTRLTASTLNALKYTDGSVISDKTYYYVVTAVKSDGTESAYSDQVSATVP
jgi:hypothetical protein